MLKNTKLSINKGIYKISMINLRYLTRSGPRSINSIILFVVIQAQVMYVMSRLIKVILFLWISQKNIKKRIVLKQPSHFFTSNIIHFFPRKLLVCSGINSASFLLLSIFSSINANAAGITTLDEVEVRANATDLLGVANTAAEGTVLKEQLDKRTIYRPGELFETVPGLIVTQHSGEGKANQYFLRGFNLDHGTDLRISVDGMLVNQRSHGHGQGWADTNFIIPELVGGIQYRKGPYYADQGDFSSAGAMNTKYINKLPQGILRYGVGQQGFMRGLIADSHEVGAGDVLYAFELMKNNGPWTKKDKFNKFNGVLRYSQDTGKTKFNVTGMGYGGRWHATDQIPERAIDSGLLSLYDTLDSSDGGEAHRFSLSAALEHLSDYGVTKVNLYTLHTNLHLFSNFTYFLDDPINGDQFSQRDKRYQSALDVKHQWVNELAGVALENTAGFQFQNDVIDNSLHNTKRREVLSTTRRDHIDENSIGLYFQNSIQWHEKLRTVAGVRTDFYWFDVNNNLDVNSGKEYDSITNPKFSVILGPWYKTELYFSYGSGFHSNDARGTVATVDPKTGESLDRVNPLVRQTGFEAGLRTAILPGLQTALSFFHLNSDSELVYVGDAGTTEASRPSKRQGFEVSAFYKPTRWLLVDVDYALTHARFKGSDPAGNHIPLSIRSVGKVALAIDHIGPFFGGVQFRYFGKRPLVEDNSVESRNIMTLNGQIGYKVNKRVELIVQGFNLLNTRAHTVDYYYESRLPGEPDEGVADKHFHPIESRAIRFNVVGYF